MTNWLRDCRTQSERPVRVTSWWESVTDHLNRVKKLIKSYLNNRKKSLWITDLNSYG